MLKLIKEHNINIFLEPHCLTLEIKNPVKKGQCIKKKL